MSELIRLQAIPTQSLNATRNGDRYRIVLKFDGENVNYDIFRNEINILYGFQAVAGSPLIPYQYLESGNFIFVTENDELPDYTKFGVTQFLLYVTQDELESVR